MTKPSSSPLSAARRVHGALAGPTLRRRLVLTASFVVALLVFHQPTPERIRSFVPDNVGDPCFIIWSLSWVNHAIGTAAPLLDANIFWPRRLTLAYSDTMLPWAPVFALLSALAGRWVPALNLLVLLLVLLNFAATYSLARWLDETGSSAGPVLAALSFAFGSYALAHYGHINLQAVGLLPLTLLLLFRVLVSPTLRSSLALGISFAVASLSSGYYGALLAVATTVILVTGIPGRSGFGFRSVPWLLLSGALALVLVLPVGLTYVRLQHDPAFRRLPSDVAIGELRFQDLFSPAPRNWLYSHVGKFDETVEHRLAPSVIATALAVPGFWLAVRRRRGEDLRPAGLEARQRARLSLVAAGGSALILGLGRQIFQFPGPFMVLQDYVPGFAAIRVPARFGVLFLLAISILASAGLSALLARIQGGWRRSWLAMLVLLLVALESWVPLPRARLDTTADTLAVYRELARRAPGPVLELPTGDLATIPGSLLETPRLVYGTLDWHPRVNGYSGFVPPDYFGQAAMLNSFPAPPALSLVRALGVRYVLLHVGGRNGFPVLSDAQAEKIIQSLPPHEGARRYGHSWLVELDSSRTQ